MESSLEVAQDYDQVQAFVADPKWVHFVGMLMRPGVGGCAETLEHTHYKPGTPANDLFQLHIIKWEDLVWGLISIPIEDRSKMDRAAAANGLRVADGVPTMVNGQGGELKVSRFPVENDRIFTLENVSGHPVYKGFKP